MRALVIICLISFFPRISYGDFYFETGLEDGGKSLSRIKWDKEIWDIHTPDSQNLNLGGDVRIAIGYQLKLGESDEHSVSVALGYIWDELDGDNGEAEFDVTTLEAIYSRHFDRHRLGVGVSYHVDPSYEDDLDGSPPNKIDFDDATGLVLQYTYEVFSGTPFHFGLRFTEMDYEVGSKSFDASGFGIFLAFSKD